MSDVVGSHGQVLDRAGHVVRGGLAEIDGRHIRHYLALAIDQKVKRDPRTPQVIQAQQRRYHVPREAIENKNLQERERERERERRSREISFLLFFSLSFLSHTGREEEKRTKKFRTHLIDVSRRRLSSFSCSRRPK